MQSLTGSAILSPIFPMQRHFLCIGNDKRISPDCLSRLRVKTRGRGIDGADRVCSRRTGTILLLHSPLHIRSGEGTIVEIKEKKSDSSIAIARFGR